MTIKWNLDKRQSQELTQIKGILDKAGQKSLDVLRMIYLGRDCDCPTVTTAQQINQLLSANGVGNHSPEPENHIHDNGNVVNWQSEQVVGSRGQLVTTWT